MRLFSNIIRSVFGIFLGLVIIGAPIFTVKADEINDLNNRIEEKRQDVERLEDEAKLLESEIEAKKIEAASLNNQIEIIDVNIKKTENQINETQVKIEQTILEIADIENKIKEKEIEINNQKNVLGEFVKVMYRYEQTSPVEILFSYDSFSDFLDQGEYLLTLENNGKKTLDNVKRLREELQWQQVVLESKRTTLEGLRTDLDNEKNNLEGEMDAKQNLLNETKSQESKYQELLEQARAEYQAAQSEISQVEQEIRQRLTDKKEDFNWENSGGTTLSWPIFPSQGISAYFMDPDYYSVFGVSHYGIDIPAPQNTAIHAPADGLVVKNHDAGMGYSYIVLLHSTGAESLSTVYGHVTSFTTVEGQAVKKGDIVGYSGGAPGTPGAGWLTTGPHLHFETRINGIPQDPLKFLP